MARVLRGPVVEEAVAGRARERRGQAGAAGGDGQRAGRRGLAPAARLRGGPAAGRADRRGAGGAGRDQRPGRRPARGHRPHVGKLARRLDDSFERIVRRIFFRKRRAAAERPRRRGQPRPGAFAIDGVFVNLAFTALVALVTLVDNAFGGGGDGGSNFAIAVGSTAWLALGVALPGRLLVAGRADAGDALPRHPPRTRGGCRCGAR